MAKIKDMLHEEYLGKGTRPDGAMKLTVIEKNPEFSGMAGAAKKAGRQAGIFRDRRRVQA